MEVGDFWMADDAVGGGGGSVQHVVGEEVVIWLGQDLHMLMSDARTGFFATIIQSDVSVLAQVTERVPQGGNI